MMLRKGMQQIPPFLLLCITFTHAIHIISTGKFTQTHGGLHITFAAVARVLFAQRFRQVFRLRLHVGRRILLHVAKCLYQNAVRLQEKSIVGLTLQDRSQIWDLPSVNQCIACRDPRS